MLHGGVAGTVAGVALHCATKVASRTVPYPTFLPYQANFMKGVQHESRERGRVGQENAEIAAS